MKGRKLYASEVITGLSKLITAEGDVPVSMYYNGDFYDITNINLDADGENIYISLEPEECKYAEISQGDTL